MLEARAELYSAAGEALARRESPPDSVTPASLLTEEEEGYLALISS